MGKLDTADELRKQGRYKEAIPLYLEGMREQSTVMHFFALGDCYEHVGDYANAITYYEKGDKVGDRWASDALGQIYENGRGVRKDLGKAVKYYERASVLVPPSKIGDLYFYGGPGLESDNGKAFMWYSKDNDATSQAMRGFCYLYGYGVSKDTRKGIEILRAASTSAIALRLLGDCYNDGYGVTKDYSEAFYYYKAAVEHPYVDEDWRSIKAYGELGRYYIQGYGCVADEKKGFELLKKGAGLGSLHAITMLGIAYSTGLGTPKDVEKGSYWLNKAIENNYQPAIEARDGLRKHGIPLK